MSNLTIGTTVKLWWPYSAFRSHEGTVTAIADGKVTVRFDPKWVSARALLIMQIRKSRTMDFSMGHLLVQRAGYPPWENAHV